MNTDELKAEVAKYKWWHQINLGNGVVTPGECDHGQTPQELSERWGIPQDLTGKSVLDIGCWDGLFTVACLRRGAATVDAVDVVERPTMYLVTRALGYADSLAVAQYVRDAQEDMRVFSADVVLCFGVIYHVERPLEVIRNAVWAAQELVIIETAVDLQTAPPAWILKRGHGGDPTNIWYPNAAAVLDAMKTFGCESAKMIWHMHGRATFVGRKARPIPNTPSVY